MYVRQSPKSTVHISYNLLLSSREMFSILEKGCVLKSLGKTHTHTAYTHTLYYMKHNATAALQVVSYYHPVTACASTQSGGNYNSQPVCRAA